MNKPVHDYRKDGLRFRLYPDGNITASSKDLPERSLYQLDCVIWLTGKKFSSICQAMIREGFLDDMLAEQARISRERGMKRNAGVELYAALEGILGIIEDSKGLAGYHMNGTVAEWDDFREVNEAYEALAKARGESGESGGDMTDHVKNQLCARIEELEKEKLELNEQLDALQKECEVLSAHVERLQQGLRRCASLLHCNFPTTDKDKAHKDAVESLKDKPATSLAHLKAQWQAEVLESCENMAETSFISCLGREEQVVLMDGILKVAAELRRQAEWGA